MHLLHVRVYLTALVLSLTLSFSTSAQTVFWQDNFDGTGPNLGGGDRDAPNHVDRDNGTGPGICGTGDYFFRSDVAGDNSGNSDGLDGPFVGFTNSFWRFEDLDGCIASPDVIDFTGIDISGRTALAFRGLFAARPQNIRFEDDDNIIVSYQIDGGGYTSGIEFWYDNTGPNPGPNNQGELRRDRDGDQVGDLSESPLNFTFTEHAFVIPGTGTTLDLRLSISMDGGSESGGVENFRLEESSPLPVELTAFDATHDAPGSLALSWATATETNNAGFAVERALDVAGGRVARSGWMEVGFVGGVGTTTEAQAYSYRISDLEPGRYQLRLRQVDFDGTFSYSPVVEATVEVPGQVFFSAPAPNPFTSRTRLRLATSSDQTVRVEVFDALGRPVAMLFEGHVQADLASELTLEAGDLPAGTYLIRATGETFVETQRVTLVR
ncbi:MAG: T9SS type A sorting domain-containing protein [Bacteroidota bacterium]